MELSLIHSIRDLQSQRNVTRIALNEAGEYPRIFYNTFQFAMHIQYKRMKIHLYS